MFGVRIKTVRVAKLAGAKQRKRASVERGPAGLSGS